MKKLEQYRFWYRLFLLVGLFGVLDIATRPLLGIGDAGVVLYVVLRLFERVVSLSFSARITDTLYFIFAYSLIPLVIALVVRRKIHQIESGMHADTDEAERTS